jgi:thiosulfate reductase/polysulfide reductase chain A
MVKQHEVKKTSCAFCGNLCGVLLHVEDGKLVKIEGNREHPLSQGFMCERGRLALRWLHHPGQLMYPSKRVGRRGEGKWQRISWDDALGEIGGKLLELKQAYGPETLGIFEGCYRGNDYWPRARFLSLFGNPHNIFAPGVICGINCMAISMAVMGDVISWGSHFARSKCLVFWGANPSESDPRQWVTVLKHRRERDIKIIVIDPRQTRTTDIADIWLRPRPGTDTALAMAWLNVIISEKLYDKEFVDRWTVGFEKLQARVEQYPPERVAEITGVPAQKIAESAIMYATNRPASMPYGVTIDQQGLNGTRTEQARIIMHAITGNLGIPGGQLIRRPRDAINGGRFVTEADLALIHLLPMQVRKKQLGADLSRLTSLIGWGLGAEHIERVYGGPAPVTVQTQAHVPLLWRSILSGKPYPIKALIAWASNPLAWAGNINLVYEALRSDNLELHVVQELFMTPSAQLADYVLPAASWMERDLCNNYMDFGSLVMGGERGIPPLGERRDAFQLFRGLGLAVGQREYWPWETLEEVGNYRLKPLGVTFRELVNRMILFPDKRELQPWLRTGFPTPSGKIELYSSILEKLGYDPMPYYEEPPESPIRTPDVAREYPLILNTGGNFMPMFHSEFMQRGIGAREKHPEPLMDIHPDTAGKLGIGDGDWAYIETRRGRIKQRARYNAGMLPNVVNCQASWWFPEKPTYAPEFSGVFESNANVLTLDDVECCDELSGGWCDRGLLCKVYRA